VIHDARIRDVERELARLRAAVADETRSPGLRTSVMTHVAWVPEHWVDAATKTLGGLEERHPSRTILLFPRPESSRDAIDADVDLRCFATGGGQVCFEVIELELCGPRASAPGTIVAPLLVADLPAFLRWRGALPFGESPLEQLTRLADRLIVDSREWEDADRDLARLAELFDRIAVSDIAWARLEPWRVALARLWPGIAELETVRVRGARADALLLAGWLDGRLGRDVELEHEPADELEAVDVDGEQVDSGPAPEKSPSDLLSDQLDVFGRDRIYEEAVRSFSRVAT
jgi:glucose-6-phosphate dehydrogenase assembly protein OpcA